MFTQNAQQQTPRTSQIYDVLVDWESTSAKAAKHQVEGPELISRDLTN